MDAIIKIEEIISVNKNTNIPTLSEQAIRDIDREADAETLLATGIEATEASREIQHAVMRGDISFEEGVRRLVSVAKEKA